MATHTACGLTIQSADGKAGRLEWFVSALFSLAPVARASFLVSDSEDDEGVIDLLVRDKVRKPVDQYSASLRPNRCARRRIVSEEANSAFNLCRE